MRRLLLLLLAPVAAGAQNVSSPITRSLYVALGSDPAALHSVNHLPLAVSAGVEQSREGSRWSWRLGVDYLGRRSSYDDTRWEDFGVSVGARYGRRSGALRPYLLGGVGIAQLRSRGSYVPLYPDGPIDFISARPSPIDFSTVRWNGSILAGLGVDARVGRYAFFVEPRLTFYPPALSDRKPYRSLLWTEALFFGFRF